MSSTTIEKPTDSGSKVPFVIFLMIVVGFAATTLPQPQVLGRLPLQNLLKTELKIDPTQMASFFFMVGLPWYFKPFAGILTDAFPLFGSKRKKYIIAGSLLACLSWVGLTFTPHQYNPILMTCIVINIFMVIASTVMGAYMVEAGQKYAAGGRLTALRQFTQSACNLVNGPLSGFLASGAFALATGSAAVLVLALAPFAWFYMREPQRFGKDANVLATASSQFKTIFTSKTLWIAALFMFLLYVAPGFSTPLYYVQTNDLKFDQQMIGNLGLYGGIAGLVAAAAYSWLCRKLTLRPLLFMGVGAAAFGAIWYLFYKNYPAAIGIESQNAFFFTFAELAVMDLALRSTPKGCEGFGFSLLMSVRNLALFGTDILGSYLYDKLHIPFTNLVWLNAGSSAAVLLVVPFLPKAILATKDAEGVPEEVVEAAEDLGQPKR